MDKKEEIQKFVKANLKHILMLDFPYKIYKENKRVLFSMKTCETRLKCRRTAKLLRFDHYFKIKYFKDEDQLNNIFNCPFFSENISDPDYYREKYRTDVSKVDVDFRGLASEEYKNDFMAA